MRIRTQLLLCPLLILGLTQSLAAQTQETWQRAEALLEQYLADTGLPGLAVSVGVDGQLAWSRGYGYADVEQQVPVRPAVTRFRVGSIAKPLTMVAVGQLAEAGSLDIDAPVQAYVDFPDKRGQITTRLLAGHLAGIRHYRGDEFFSQRHYETVEEGLDIFRDDPLLAMPGERYSYSSYGYNLIGAVVASAAQQDFLAYMQERVFQPLGMLSTVADEVSAIVPDRSRYYELQDGELRNSPPVDNSYKWPGGGFLSTTEDLIRFGHAMLQAEILDAETIKVLWTAQTDGAGESTGYGMGWMVSPADQEPRVIYHSGDSVGGTTVLWLIPAEDLVIAAVTNTSGADMVTLARRLQDLLL